MSVMHCLRHPTPGMSVTCCGSDGVPFAKSGGGDARNVVMADGDPLFAGTFDEQVRICGEHSAAEPARSGYTTADILDASV